MNQREMTRKMYHEVSYQLAHNKEVRKNIYIMCRETVTDAETRRIEKAILDLSERLLNKSKVLK
mgnify:FL=1